MNNERTEFDERCRIEMRGILLGYGYDAEHADRLVAEGMGPEELRERLSCGAEGVGSLAHTHGIRPKS